MHLKLLQKTVEATGDLNGNCDLQRSQKLQTV